jgi:uncharacterized LabA/DUF88 family protein
MYERFKQYGYDLVFKKTVKDRMGKPKGNVDAEIVLHASRLEYDNYDIGIFVSGDGDFACLYDFLNKENKLGHIIIPNKHSESSLLKPWQDKKIFLFREKNRLQLKV